MSVTKLITIAILPFALTVVGCKKKDNKPATTMTVTSGSDTLFTTTNVVTANQNNGTVFITATSTTTNEKIDLAISGFTEGAKSYYIDYRGTGGNITGNTGKYTKNNNLYEANRGNIYVTSVTNNTITGSFNLYTSTLTINGTFVAAER